MNMKSTAPTPLSQGAFALAVHVRDLVETFLDTIVETLGTFLRERTPAAFLQMEEGVQKLFARVGGHVVGGILGLLIEDPVHREQTMESARDGDPRKLRNQGYRETSVRFLGGVCLDFRIPYASTDRGDLPGFRRGVGRRGKAGGGAFPLLDALGIHHRATPALASLVARLSARCASFEEASEALREHGVDMDAKGVRRLCLHVGEEALRQRGRRIDAVRDGDSFDRRKCTADRRKCTATEEFTGKRIVISVDGGRIRLREGGERGPKGKRGHRRYDTPWREPKILTVYVIDEKGRKIDSIAPLIDGTLGDADATFDILVSELVLRGAAQAREIIVIGDGALWIWNRVDALARTLGFPPERIVRVADFYHAVEHLADIAELVKSFGEAAKKRWVKRMRRRLKRGKVDQVIESAAALCRGSNAKEIASQVDYFRKRRELMRYDEFQNRGIPLGSGAVESAVRRVVNLRLKGPAIFWRQASAEAMLHLRAYLKAGRWSELMSRVMHRSPDGQSSQPRKAAA